MIVSLKRELGASVMVNEVLGAASLGKGHKIRNENRVNNVYITEIVCTRQLQDRGQ